MHSRKPNVVLIMTDQQRADLSAREGYPVDTTPCLDRLARTGAWFNRAYTAAPICVAARVSLLTGRYPVAHRVCTNHNMGDAFYQDDIFDVAREFGYSTAMIGKNHSHLTPGRVDHWFESGHSGPTPRLDEHKRFNDYIVQLNHRAASEPTPFPLEFQGPVRCVNEAISWIDSIRSAPFFMWLSFAAPHNPYQVPEPYFSLFPPESLPPVHFDKECLSAKGRTWEFVRKLGELAFPDYEEQIPRARANYHGMLRLIDDQISKFVDHLDKENLLSNTLLVFVSDHGDFAGEYGLMRKGPEMPELLMRVPLFFHGPGVKAEVKSRSEHVSITDVMPTLCETMGASLPPGTQGRSLLPLITGGDFPADEFSSVFAEQGFGGLDFSKYDVSDLENAGALTRNVRFDCLNSWTQSSRMRMVRIGDWKLTFNLQGQGRMYKLENDPFETIDLFNQAEFADKRLELLQELLTWSLRTQDILPLPGKYEISIHPQNYLH